MFIAQRQGLTGDDSCQFLTAEASLVPGTCASARFARSCQQNGFPERDLPRGPVLGKKVMLSGQCRSQSACNAAEMMSHDGELDSHGELARTSQKRS